MDAFGKQPKYASYHGVSAGTLSKHVTGSAQKFIENDAGPGVNLRNLSDLSQRLTSLESRFDRIDGQFDSLSNATPALTDLIDLTKVLCLCYQTVLAPVTCFTDW